MGNRQNRLLRGAIIMIAFIMLSFSCAPAVHAQFQEDFAEEELILVVTKDQYVLSNGFIAIQRGGRYYLPLTQLAEMLDFFVDIDLERGTADGWYLQKDNIFSINAETNEIINRGKRRTIQPDDIIIDNNSGFGDMYVLLEELNDLWPVTFSVDLYALALRIESEQKLPFEKQLQREERRTLATNQTRMQTEQRKDLPFIKNDYRFIGLPSLDLDGQTQWNDSKKDLTSRLRVSGAQDLLWAQADYNTTLTYNRDGELERPDSIRLRFLRQFLEDEAPLGIREIKAGDTRMVAPEHIENSISGRGVVISSEPVAKERTFDEITIEGTAQAGWETELYRNNQLIEFGIVDETGQYLFENVELNVGNNQFRIVLYGPQGQIEERTESYMISGSMLKPGDTEYQLGIVDSDRPFILLENDPRTTPRGMAQEGRFKLGLTNWLTLFGTATRTPLRTAGNAKGKDGKYVTVGAMFTGLGGFGQVEAYKATGGGRALDIQFATQALGVNLNLESAFFKDFESDINGYDGAAKIFDGALRANRNFKLAFGSLGLQLNTNHEERENGTSQTRITTRQSFSRAGINITHATNSALTNKKHTSSTARLTATVRMRQWQLRSGVNYTIYPDTDITGANAELRYRGHDSFSAAVSVQHNFLRSILTTGAQLSYDFGKFLGSVDADWQKERGFIFTLRASTSLGPLGTDGGYEMSSRKLTAATPVKARVFVDRDSDGRYDAENDDAIKDARLMLDGRSTQERTNENGTVVVRNAGGPAIRNVSLDQGSLYDPYFRPATDGYRTLVRQGGMPSMDFPVMETGAIDGTVLNDETGAPVEGMRLQLIDHKGDIVQRVSTAYDGFYSFEYVPQGQYTVRADPSYGVNVPAMDVAVESDDLFAYGIDLALMKRTAATGTQTENNNDTAKNDKRGRVAQPGHEKTVAGIHPAPSSGDGAFAATVKRVRIGEHTDKIRLVLDLSGPVTYRLSCRKNCREIYIDLPATAWDAIQLWRADTTPVIERFSTEALSGSNRGTRMIIKAQTQMDVGLSGMLPAENDKSRRLYIDLKQ